MSTSTIRAIETVYNGYRFRSRLEARWAVFFDTLGIQYEYEKEGFEFGGAGGPRYLPDFYIPSLDYWLEIKPAVPTEPETVLKASALAIRTARPVFLFCGDVWPDAQWANCSAFAFMLKSVFFPGPPPEDGRTLPPGAKEPLYIAQHYCWCECPGCHAVEIHKPNMPGDEHLMHPSCMVKYVYSFPRGTTPRNIFNGGVHRTPRLMQAYTAARQARFEFGARGR